MLLVGLAVAGTLPTACPATIATGDDVAAYRAEVVVPAVLSVAERLATLRADYGDANCPDAAGAACTSTAGVGFQGTLEEGSWSSGYWDELCTRGYTWVGTTEDDVTAGALVAAKFDGVTVRADGIYADGTSYTCGYTDTYRSWTGALAVEGAWQDLADDALEGTASRLYTYMFDPHFTYTWDGTTGDCAWSGTLDAYDYYMADGTAYVNHYGETVVSGHTVDWYFSAHRECETCAWQLCSGRTRIDGSWAGGPLWAADEAGADVPAWVDDDQDGVSADCDCDDADADAYPGATEAPGNTVDEDCDGVADDVDGDGSWGVRDCDDLDPGRHIGAAEICPDGIDQDCDGEVDEDCDDDGFTDRRDCDDADASVYPEAPEVCGDGIDQDCDGADEACPDTGATEDTAAPPPAATPVEEPATGGCGRGGSAFVLALLPAAFRRGRRREPRPQARSGEV